MDTAVSMDKYIIGALIKMERHKQNRGQRELAFGICVPSYLSKIEHGQVKPEAKILQLIFQKLGIEYIDDSIFIEEKKKKIEEFHTKLNYGMDARSVYEMLKEDDLKLSYSILALDWMLIKLQQEDKIGDLLAGLEDLMTTKQSAYYDIICYFTERKVELSQLENACKIIGNSFAYLTLCEAYLLSADYSSIHRMENRLTSLALEEGNTYQLARYYFFKGSAYACLNQTDMMMLYYNRSINLLQNTGWKDLLQDIYYNVGATFINMKKYDFSLDYLDKITTDLAESFHVLHKKALANIRKGNLPEGKRFLETIQNKYLKGFKVKEADLLKYEEAVFECQANFLDDPNYLILLEELIRKLKKEYHFGHLFFYSDVIIEAYIRNRKYKKALEFKEEISRNIIKS